MDWREIRHRDRTSGRGIFAVRNRTTGRVLIAASSNLAKRLFDERAMLAARRHYNPGLQRDLEEHGLDSFAMYLIETCGDGCGLRLRKYVHTQKAITAGTTLYNRRNIYSKNADAGGIRSAPPVQKGLEEALALLRSATDRFLAAERGADDPLAAWMDRVFPPSRQAASASGSR